MRILAFFFAAEDTARAAAAALRSEHDIARASLETAPLVVDRVEGTILAVSAEDDRAESVIELVVNKGGRLVASVAEERTRPI